MATRNRPSSTAEAAPKVIAATETSVPQTTDSGRSARRTTRFDSRRTLAHRRIVRELDEWFGIFKYPDPAVLYAISPSREAALDG